ncbi:hypothetical protein H0H93_008764 [Arthromyces matolae]|nr:hypothetical protein H0H93_008764 [Arthromyces matolae]
MPKAKTQPKRNTQKAAPDHGDKQKCDTQKAAPDCGDAGKESRKLCMPVEVNVPLPNIEHLALAEPAVQGKQSIQSILNRQKSRYQVFAEHWKNHVDRFQLKVDLEKLD